MNSDFHPLASIVIPVYNGANFMREAIDSALAQTYDNIEVIVVNDGSRDDGETESIALSYGDRIRYFSKENGGCASALNLGISQMRGDYFSWLSHDDRYLPNKIARQIEVLDSFNDKDTIVFSGYELIDAKSIKTGTVRPDALLTPAQLSIPVLPLMRGLVHGCSLLIPRKHFDVVGLFDVSLPSTQDYALWFELFRMAPLHFDHEINVQSRVHPDQGTHKIESHIEECNVLWSSFLKKLSPEEMVAMGGTKHSFLLEQAKFLANTPYKEAANLAIKMAEVARVKITVSVIIPFYNRVAWTIEAIESVLEQTYQKFEILLIDDGSTDDLSTLMDFIQNDSRIIYLRQDNAGPAKARNLGIERATGDYISFLDSDDLFHREKLETQLNFMLNNGYAFSHTSYQRIDLKGHHLEDIRSAQGKGNVFPTIISSCQIAMPTVMVRSDFARRYRFPEHLEIAEDVCLWIKISSDVTPGALDRVLTKVRVGPTTAALDLRKQAIGLINIAHYAIHDPKFSQFSEHIVALLKSATSKVQASACDHSANLTSSRPSRVEKGLFLLERGVFSIRTNGLRATLHRTRRYLGRY